MNQGGATAAALLLALLLAAPAGAVDVLYQTSARAELRLRTPLPGDTSSTLTGDLELNPQGDVAFTWTSTTLGLQYAPTLIWREPQTGGRLLPLHRLRAALGHRWDRVTLLASQEGTQGMLDVGSLRAAPGALPGVAPEVQTLGPVPYVRSASVFSLDARPTDRTSFYLQGGYFVSGSPDPEEENLPLQWGPAVSGAFRARVSNRDTFLLGSQLFQAVFLTGQEQFFVTATTGWERQLSRPILLSLSGGAALTRQRLLSSAFALPGVYIEVLPVASATLGWRERLLRMPIRVEASLRLSPFADRFTGAVYERLEARVFAEWLPEQRWTVTGAGGVAYVLPIGLGTQAGDSLVYAEGAAVWEARTWLLLGLSARVLFSQSPRLGLGGMFQAVTSVSVTVRDQGATAW